MQLETQNLATSYNDIPTNVLKSMHRHRHAQFCKRLNWSLPESTADREKDQFDDGNSEYIFAYDRDEHLGSFRLRSAKYGTMIEQCFRQSFPASVDFIQQNRNETYEITRLLASPLVDTAMRNKVCSALRSSLHLEQMRKPHGFFLAVVSAPILRLFRLRKGQFEIIEIGILDGSMAVSLLLRSNS